MKGTIPVWFELAECEGVLELPAAAGSSVALELHVVVCRDGTGTTAWWEDQHGRWLAAASVGTG